MAICAPCKQNVPKFKRSNCLSRSTSFILPGAVCASEWNWLCDGFGTAYFTTTIAKIDSTPVIQKIPGTPINSFNKGAATSEIANVKPMVAPIIAMAFVRCSSRVESATSAVTTAEIAPAP